MKELSLNILDIAQNSVKASATEIQILLNETEEILSLEIIDNGCGMSEDFLKNVTNPFSTTRKTRRVGLGLPFLKMEAEMTGGAFEITSKSEKEHSDHGTRVSASFLKNSIDYIPLGDIVGTVCTLIQGSDGIDFLFSHKKNGGEVRLCTREMKEMLGNDVPLSEPEVILWVKEYLNECYSTLSRL